MAASDKEEHKQATGSNEVQAGSDQQAAAKQKPETQKGPSKTGRTDNRMTGNMDFLLDIPLEISVELGRTKILINELLKLGQGSVIELSKLAGETLEILANQKLVARGEVVVVNEKYGVRLTEIISPSERIERLQ
jgi:flagellar motor switch protein FliN/FliY